MRLLLLFYLVLTFAAGIAAPGFAQGTATPSAHDTDRAIEGWRAQLDQISSAIKRSGVSTQELLEFRERVTRIRDEAAIFSDSLTPTIQSLTSRLQTLTLAENAALSPQTSPQGAGETKTEKTEPPQSPAGQVSPAAPGESSPGAANPPPASAQPSAISQAKEALAKDISELTARITELNSQSGRAQVIVLRSDELIAEITQLRRRKFKNELLGQAKSLLAPSLWFSAARDVAPLINSAWSIWTSGSNRILNEASVLFIMALSGSFSLALLLLRYFKPLKLILPPSAGDGEPEKGLSRRVQSFNAFRQVARSVIFFALIPTVLLLALNQAGVLSSRLSELLWAILETIFYYALARGLSQAIFSPGKAPCRLVDLDDAKAGYIHRTIIACLTIALVGFLAIDFARTLVASADFIVLVYGVTAAAFSGLAFFSYFIRPQKENFITALRSDILMIKIAGAVGFLALLVALFAPLAGFPYLAGFSIGQVILAGIIAAILYLCFTLLDTYLGTDTPPPGASVDSHRGDNEKERRYAQFMMLASGAGKIVLTIIGLGIFAASWGLDTTGIWEDLARLFREIKIGELSISPATIVTAFVVLAIGVLITRSFQGWLSNRFLPTTRLDTGLRNSITTGMGYLGFIASAMIAFSQAGLDLSNLAIVAGALSLGIGFGLQSIVSNFVSGIILLAERPIKAGDWVVVGGEEGTVRKISVRSTEIETFDRATVIMPNADFISGAVKNMMYGNTIGRFIVTVGVSYDSDPEHVRKILLDVANNHPLVLAYPETYVLFSDFGASSLDFELRGYLADCSKSISVRSDLRFAIFSRLKEEGIELPFPQRDINIKGLEGRLVHIDEPSSPPSPPLSSIAPEKPASERET